MRSEELLKRCHAYLRGVEINTPNGCQVIHRDTLAREINTFLNDKCDAQNVEQQPEQLKLGCVLMERKEGGTCA